jgi:hypothetical protein
MERNSTAAPEGATTLTTNPDAAIIAAFERRAAAFHAARALPDDPATGGETDAQSPYWATIDAAEEEIRATVATTPRGAELQLWLAATYVFDTADDEPRCYAADLEYFEAQGNKRDWTDRLMIAALRSLREQGK